MVMPLPTVVNGRTWACGTIQVGIGVGEKIQGPSAWGEGDEALFLRLKLGRWSDVNHSDENWLEAP